ncbi:MAG: hypothetical protein K0R82_2879 [Flavipsychrobacter sp.]|jgi:hypothetical protein|nr:hypothetical protein [Flavipsychrobacter sp.]
MIKRLAFAAILLLPATLQAQDVVKGSSNTATQVEKPARDFVMLQVAYEGWKAPDSINTTGFGRAFNAYLCYDFPIGKSNFSFAGGIGIGTSNVYLKDQEIVLNDTAAPAATFIPETRDYKKYKLTTAYLEAPFELRFFGNKINRNKGFKAAAGLRVGTLVGAHVKGKDADTKIVYKTNTKNYLENWRFAVTGRLGWGNFSLYGAYNLTNLYKDNAGPTITPYQLGLCITGL